AALACRQRGIGVTLFEQAAELRELGAGLQLSANGTRILIALGLRGAMERIVAEPTGKEVRLFSTGQTWKLFDLGAESVKRYGAPYWMVHRGDFHRVLVDALGGEGGAIVCGVRCSGFAERDGQVDIRFADRTQARADVLVGADGVHSELRRQMF